MSCLRLHKLEYIMLHVTSGVVEKSNSRCRCVRPSLSDKHYRVYLVLDHE